MISFDEWVDRYRGMLAEKWHDYAKHIMNTQGRHADQKEWLHYEYEKWCREIGQPAFGDHYTHGMSRHPMTLTGNPHETKLSYVVPIDADRLKYMQEQIEYFKHKEHMNRTQTSISDEDMKFIKNNVPGMHDKGANTLINETKKLKPILKLILKRKCQKK